MHQLPRKGIGCVGVSRVEHDASILKREQLCVVCWVCIIAKLVSTHLRTCVGQGRGDLLRLRAREREALICAVGAEDDDDAQDVGKGLV